MNEQELMSQNAELMKDNYELMKENENVLEFANKVISIFNNYKQVLSPDDANKFADAVTQFAINYNKNTKP